jgi:plastocyanin
MRWKSALAAGCLAIVGVVLAAGCGSGSSASPATTTEPQAQAEGTTLQLAAVASGAFEYDKKTLEAPAGEVTIVMTNPSSVPHDIAIEGNGVHVAGKVVTNGGQSTVSADLKPGTYTFYCTVDDHEQLGMKGVLTVR